MAAEPGRTDYFLSARIYEDVVNLFYRELAWLEGRETADGWQGQVTDTLQRLIAGGGENLSPAEMNVVLMVLLNWTPNGYRPEGPKVVPLPE